MLVTIDIKLNDNQIDDALKFMEEAVLEKNEKENKFQSAAYDSVEVIEQLRKEVRFARKYRSDEED